MLIARSKEPKENKQPTTTGGRQFIKICMYLGKSGKMWGNAGKCGVKGRREGKQRGRDLGVQ